MDESSLLELTAEVSVAVAGFISIFLVLAAREGRFSPGDAFTIRLIVIGGGDLLRGERVGLAVGAWRRNVLGHALGDRGHRGRELRRPPLQQAPVSP